MTIRIGSRKSRLAMRQTEMVCGALQKVFPGEKIEIVPVSTCGDRNQSSALSEMGGKGVFTKELETMLLGGAIDLAVHSAKDLPEEVPDGLAVLPVLGRPDVNDCAVTLSGTALSELPPGSVVGTGSSRRILQVMKFNSNVRVENIRGNIETRIRKLKEGKFDCIILAAAGMERLGLTGGGGLRIEKLEASRFIPAAGQGILAVEYRGTDDRLKKALGKISYRETEIMFRAERAFLDEIGGGCNAPCGAVCQFLDDETVELYTMYSGDLARLNFIARRCTADTAAETARKMADDLLDSFGQKPLHDKENGT